MAACCMRTREPSASAPRSVASPRLAISSAAAVHQCTTALTVRTIALASSAQHAHPFVEQMGTLGAGNHYAEIQVVDEIFDEAAARKMGIEQTGQVCVMIHSGSRGLGHQVSTVGAAGFVL